MNSLMRDELADAWLELDHDPEVRVIVHTGNGRAFQTGVDVTEIATDGQGFQRYRDSMENFDVHFTAWHQARVEAGHLRGERHLRRRCIPLGRRLRHRDRGIGRAVLRPARVSIGQVVSIEAIGLIRRMPAEAVMRMAFVGKYERMNAQRAYELGMISQIVDPPEQLREEAQKLAETRRPELPDRHALHEEGAVGRVRSRAHRRVQERRAASRRDVGSSRPGRRPGLVRREARSQLGPARLKSDRLVAR